MRKPELTPRMGASDLDSSKSKPVTTNDVFVEGDNHLEGVPLSIDANRMVLKRTIIFDSEGAD